jgi:transcriptional regulator with XRE-family HTH domain
MPRPPKVVKNELSRAIAELRRRLGFSQQAFANSLQLSLGAVARWELNQRPERTLLKQLISLASDHGFRDLEETLYLEYRREFGLAYDIAVNTEIAAALQVGLAILNSLPKPKKAPNRQLMADLRETLQRVLAKVIQFPSDPADTQIPLPPKAAHPQDLDALKKFEEGVRASWKELEESLRASWESRNKEAKP